MNSRKELYALCSSSRNVEEILRMICDQVKLNDASYHKCRNTIAFLLNNYVRRLSRSPKNKQEMMIIAQYLNRKCCDEIVQILIRKQERAQMQTQRMYREPVMQTTYDKPGLVDYDEIGYTDEGSMRMQAHRQDDEKPTPQECEAQINYYMKQREQLNSTPHAKQPMPDFKNLDGVFGMPKSSFSSSYDMDDQMMRNFMEGAPAYESSFPPSYN